MTDYNITDWCDFVRGLTEAPAEDEMRQQLAGSKRARRELEAMRRVVQVAHQDAELGVPDHAVRGAKAISSVLRPSERSARPSPGSAVLRYLPFRVTFDSAQHPIAAGTRNLQATDRQIRFQAESYTVDLRLEQESDPWSAVLVGEILRHGRPMSEVPVLVTSEGRIVGRSVSGRFGEFQAEGLPRAALDLCLLVEPDECIELPLAAE